MVWLALVPALLYQTRPAVRSLRQDTDLISLFGQATWNISDRWRLTLGARWSSEEKQAKRQLSVADINGDPLPAITEPFTLGLYSALFNINSHELADKRTTSGFMPSFAVQYDVTDTMMAYASYSRGIKSGGFDTRSNNPPELGGSFEFDDEDSGFLRNRHQDVVCRRCSRNSMWRCTTPTTRICR